MLLKKLTYKENIGQDAEWSVADLCFEKETLIAGKNASGKSRTARIISAFARLLSGKSTQLSNGEWDCQFENEEKKFSYILKTFDGRVKEELLTEMPDKKLVIRNNKEKKLLLMNGKKTDDWHNLMISDDILTITAHRDQENFPYLIELGLWAKNLNSYVFDSDVTNNTEYHYSKDENFISLNTVSNILSNAFAAFPDFRTNLINDLKYIGYTLNDITIGPRWIAGFPPNALMASLKEENVKRPLDQNVLSEGMFSAFAILAIINDLIYKKLKGTVIIDNLGEGLDFERSSRLSELIYEKIHKSALNLIVTTNDQFLMNKFPVNIWNILLRTGQRVKAFNYENSKKIFEDFKFTGLSNSDFFLLDFINQEQEG